MDFLDAGVGLHAEGRSDFTGQIGAGLGLANADVNGNVSHHDFPATGRMSPVDRFNGLADRPLTLACRGRVGGGGVLPVQEPASGLLLVAGLPAVAARRRSR